MCRQNLILNLSAAEEDAAEASFSIYCKPVELYNILQRRATAKPSFLQRCLQYKLHVKNRSRIEMSISLSATLNNELQRHNLFPLHILLARPVSSVAVTEHSTVYRYTRECILTGYTDLEGTNQVEAKFILPEFDKLLADIKSGPLTILFVSCVGSTSSLNEIDRTEDHLRNDGGYCLMGQIPMELLYISWEKSPRSSFGERAEILSTVDMDPCFAKFSCIKKEKRISFQIPCDTRAMSVSQQVAVTISGKEIGANEKGDENLYSNDGPSLPQNIQLGAGEVIFYYWYYGNKLYRPEVTKDFSCPFCLVKCGDFKGLKLHLPASHDLFDYNYGANEEYPTIHIFVRTDICYSEVVADVVDPKQETFYFCSKRFRQRKPKCLHQCTKIVDPLALESNFPVATNGIQDKADGHDLVEWEMSSPNATGMSNATAQSYAECDQSVLPGSSSSNLVPPMLQFARTRKLSAENSEPRTRMLLQKRKFFHSQRAQPMALEQVLADQDSEDEVDDDVADLEDRRMLDDFLDVTKDEKQMMHLWNSFVRKQRVLADSHIPWACEAFSRLHREDFVRSPSLGWCWRLFMIKLWNHDLLDAQTMNSCNIILQV